MNLPALKTVDALNDLINHPGPSVVLVGSKGCPPCVEIHPRLVALTQDYAALTFYELDVEDFAAPSDDQALTQLFQRLELQYLPSQILIPGDGPARVICTQDVDEIKRQLASLT